METLQYPTSSASEFISAVLTREEVVDAYGHVSVRHPDNPNRFLIARSLARSWWAPKTSSGST
jgi:hypothetical protein